MILSMGAKKIEWVRFLHYFVTLIMCYVIMEESGIYIGQLFQEDWTALVGAECSSVSYSSINVYIS